LNSPVEVTEMKALANPSDSIRKLEVAPPPAAREEIPAHVKWLIDNYDPPPALVDDLGRPSLKVERRPHSGAVIVPRVEETTSPSVEHAAAVYGMRDRKETFIEWLWKNYPPIANRV
jgi:hypothetical protein